MITIYKKIYREKHIHTLETIEKNCWVHIENPIENEMDDIISSLHLERDLLEDALDEYEVPRMEIDDGYTYIFIRIPQKSGSIITTTPILMVIGKSLFLTLSKKKLSLIDAFFQRPKEKFSTAQIFHLFLTFFSEIHFLYRKFLMNIGRNIRSISIQLENIDNKDIVDFVRYEGILNDILSALVPNRSTLQKPFSGKFVRSQKEEDQDLLEDLLLETGELLEICKTNLRSIVNIREGYSTIMSNNLNKVMKILTSLTIVFTIPTIVGGLYGMNVNLPFNEQNPFLFWWILGGTFLLSIFVLLFFRWKKWL